MCSFISSCSFQYFGFKMVLEVFCGVVGFCDIPRTYVTSTLQWEAMRFMLFAFKYNFAYTKRWKLKVHLVNRQHTTYTECAPLNKLGKFSFCYRLLKVRWYAAWMRIIIEVPQFPFRSASFHSASAASFWYQYCLNFETASSNDGSHS